MSDAAGRNERAEEPEQPGEAAQGEGAEPPGERARRLRERRVAAHRGARRVLAGPGFSTSLRERLALLDRADELYDLDEASDMYGNGIVAALEEKVAGLLGTEAAAFFPTGTMAQQVALRCWAGRTGNPVVALHGLSHPELHERGAFSRVSGLRPVRLTDEPRQPTAEEVRDFEEPFGALMLELPLRDAGFVLPTWEQLTETVEAARERDAVVHFDGARLWETTVHFGRTPAEIAGLADSVYVSFYKSSRVTGRRSGRPADAGRGGEGLAAPVRRRGVPAVPDGAVGTGRPGARAARLPEYVAHARVVAAALREGFAAAGLPWARVHPETPHTHEFQSGCRTTPRWSARRPSGRARRRGRCSSPAAGRPPARGSP
ncbi:threonine aldolase [Streptomyces parvulus]|nr:threonine aldolase [Streptomyces parvulus]